MKNNIIQYIHKRTGISSTQIQRTLELLNEGGTIPFIARYRKEMTGQLDEIALKQIQDFQHDFETLEKRKKYILNAISTSPSATPQLLQRIEQCMDVNELEDLYLPFKKKKTTRAETARKNGLEALAKMIALHNYDIGEIRTRAALKKSTSFPKTQDVIDGALDIIAEWMNEHITLRQKLRKLFLQHAIIHTKKITKSKDPLDKFRDYYDFHERIGKCPSHRLLAILRGEKLKILQVKLYPEQAQAIELITSQFIRRSSPVQKWLEETAMDAYKRLILPSLSKQTLSHYKELADVSAINIFNANLQQLLLMPPLGEKPLIAIDPGFKSGCKMVCIDEQGNFITHQNIYPHPPQNSKRASEEVLLSWIHQYAISDIAVGNGTAGKETVQWIQGILRDASINVHLVNEDGASIYSASEVARNEFPKLDLTVRGAISIGRRLQDPLAELVKISPKSIGVGQYQHDVNQSQLQSALDHTVVSSVNKVGINLNTASHHLLSYVAGLGPKIAMNIVHYRVENGSFAQRSELLKVPKLGKKAFEQCAGFLRIKSGQNALDNTGIHPERYALVHQMANDQDVTIDALIKDSNLIKRIDIKSYISDKIGIPTLKDMIQEMEKPGLDPRGQVEIISFDERVSQIEDLTEGMMLTGVVSNITKFGAFINIGIKQDGLVHISEMADKFVKDPLDIVHLNQKVQVRVQSVDLKRNRIQLSMKS